MTDSIIKTVDIKKSFQVGAQSVEVLKGISFEIKKGDFVIIIGPSGCGKSTLLHTILGLEPPTSGVLTLLDFDLYKGTTEDDRSEFRKKHIGMVYQQPNWIKSFNVIDNVTFPLLLLGTDKSEMITLASKALERVGMMQWAFYRPTELSSGQQQKIAIARALITNPEIVIADEPTGNLDFESGQELMSILQELNKEGKTIAMVTHDLEYLQFAHSAIRMLDGTVVQSYGDSEIKTLSAHLHKKRGDGTISLHDK